MRKHFLTLAVSLELIILTGCNSSAPVAVRPGQKSANISDLPFSCLGIVANSSGVASASAFPLESIRFENLETHEKHFARLASSFNPSVELVSRTDDQNRVIQLAIVKLPAGRYKISEVTFSPQEYGRTVRTYSVDVSGYKPASFSVVGGKINFHGSLVIITEWWGLGMGFDPGSSLIQLEKTSYTIRTENSCVADERWLKQAIPALMAFPAINSPMSDGL